MTDGPKQATPFAELERQMMDVNFAKTEREWWAWREICNLRVENIQMRAALGYPIPADEEHHIIPVNPFKCGTCDARNLADELKRIEGNQ